MQVIEGNIDEIVMMHPRLYLEHHAVMAVAILKQISPSPCDFSVQCEEVGVIPAHDSRFTLRVHWRKAKELVAERVLQSEQRIPILERAAVAVAALLLGKTIPQCPMRVTGPKQAVDFWLEDMQFALEVSGASSKDGLTERLRRKKKQVRRNAKRWDGFAMVCCFDPAFPTIAWSEVSYGKVQRRN